MAKRPEVPTRTQRAVAKKLPDDFLLCRGGRHQWDEYEAAPGEVKSGWGELIAWKCRSCGMKFFERIRSWDGSRISSWYRQPEGYRIPMDKQPSKDNLRREMLRRRKERKQAAGPAVVLDLRKKPKSRKEYDHIKANDG